jgi:hypothetical protein
MREFPNWQELEQRVSAAVKLGRQPVAVAFLELLRAYNVARSA